MSKFMILVISLYLSQSALADTVLKFGSPYKVTRIASIMQYHEFMAAALKDAGFKMELVLIPTKTTIEMLCDGDVDAISYDDKGTTDHRENIISTSFPIVYTTAKVFYRMDLKDFSEKTMSNFHAAIPQNNLSIKKEADRRHLKYTPATNPYHCIQMILYKQVDYCIAVDEVASSAIKSFDKADQKIKPLKEAFLETPIYISFLKKYQKDLPKIEQALKARLKGDLSAFPLVADHLNKTP